MSTYEACVVGAHENFSLSLYQNNKVPVDPNYVKNKDERIRPNCDIVTSINKYSSFSEYTSLNM